jgi:hypothetical protein
MTDPEHKIRDRAYALWVEDGRPHGREHAHWEQASREIADEDRTGAAPSGQDATAALQSVADGDATAPAKPQRARKASAPRAKTADGASKSRKKDRPTS